MKTTGISQVNYYAAGTASQVDPKSGQTDSFSQIFATQSVQDTRIGSQAADNKETELKTTEAEKPKDETNVDVSKAEKTEENAEEITNAEENPKEVKDEAVQEKEEVVLTEEEIEKAVEQLMTTIQEVLGVSQEDIQKALEELGIAVEDLLNTDNIPKLVIALTEGADELSLVTNEDVFMNVQQITAKAEELLQDLSDKTGLSFKDLYAAVQELMKEQPVIAEEEPVVVKAENMVDVTTTEEVRTQVEVMETVVSTHQTDDSRQESASDFQQSGYHNQQQAFAQTVVEQIEQAVSKTETVQSSYVSSENVMNQIQDVIKVIQRQDITEMELQLHPASLGSVRIQLAAKDGIITAMFTTENEAVKAALESQMVTLKQTFAEQGVKVEAIEVTVASHAFEENLNGNERSSGQDNAPNKKKGARRITLSELTASVEEENLEEDDRIVAEMMIANGNTVDYTV